MTQDKVTIQKRPALQRYYKSLESRLGYWAFLGGRRHFAYYDHDTYWPFPLTKALERMEDYLYGTLDLPPGSRVLDSGCGEGFVAIRMASKGLVVEGIDIVDYHVQGAIRNVERAGYKSTVTISHADYHHLEQFADGSFDGVYVVETLCHSTDVSRVLSEYYRVLRPAGRLSLLEYEHVGLQQMDKKTIDDMYYVNEVGSMPALNTFSVGVLASSIRKEGFENVKETDLSENARPLLRLFYIVAIIPYFIISLLGLQKHFANTVGAVVGWRADKKGYGRYTSFTATKPSRTGISSNGRAT